MEPAVTDRHRPLVRRLRLAIVLATLFCVAGLAMPVEAGRKAPDPKQLTRFMWALAGQESGWNWFARNPSSGAFGRYQIMPVNWQGWASAYVGDGWRDQNPVNQERVARGKLAALYRWLGEWRRVAYWWLTGDTESKSSRWSPLARRYVENVMSMMSRAPKKLVPPPAQLANESGFQVNRGDWRLLVESSYLRNAHARGHDKLRSIAPGLVFKVRKVEMGPKKAILWLKARMPDGKIGWLNATASVPTTAPKVRR
jgi:hypothetical protein